MMRRIFTTLIVVLVLLGVFSVPSADAQRDPTCGFDVHQAAVIPVPEPTEVPADDAPVPVAEQASAATPVRCAAPPPYPGPFENKPELPGSPYLTPVGLRAAVAPAEIQAEVEAGPITTQDEPSPLAHSGSESYVLLYLGTGLVAFGAVALGSRRRFMYD